MRVVYRVVGQPPSKGSPRMEFLCWTRRLYLRWFLPLGLFLFAMLLISSVPLWLWVLFAISAVAWLWGFASLAYRIVREQRRAS